MYKVVEVADSTLKEDIKVYKKLANKRFSLSVHVARTAIEKRADEILVSFQKGTLNLKPEQYGLFAKYIDVLGFRNKEEYFDLLQEKADFDVRKQAQKELTPWWKKIFSKTDSQGLQYLPAKKLQKLSDKYIALHEKMEDSQYGKPWLNSKAEAMRANADSYIKAYLNDEIKINPEDVEAFQRYIKVMVYPFYEGCEGEEALKKLKKEYSAVWEQANAEEEVKADKVSLWSKFKQGTQAKIVELNQNNKWYKRVAATIAGLVTVGALWLGFKDDVTKSENNGFNDKKIDKTEARAQMQETKTSDEKMIHFEFVSNEYKGIDLQTLMETAPKKETVKTETVAKVTEAKPAKTIDTNKAINNNDSVKAARINHHQVVLAMRLGASKSTEMVEEIQSKMDKGLISLPANLGAEDFVYAMEMYRGYGVESSLKEAFNNTQKLSAEQNTKVVEDIIAAGETGLGVKKMAAAMNGGKLNHKSVYNRASKKTQKQYNMNMKKWHKLKKQMSRAA